MTDNLEWLVRVEQKISDVLEHARNYGNPDYQRPAYSSSKWFETQIEAEHYWFMARNSGYTAHCYHIDDVPGTTRNLIRTVMKAESL